MKRLIPVFFLVLLGCDKKTTVSCEVDGLGMCHEWLERNESERNDVKAATCKTPDEHYREEPCRRDADVLGTCELTARREKTIRYKSKVPQGLDVVAACRSVGGTWTTAPGMTLPSVRIPTPPQPPPSGAPSAAASAAPKPSP